MDEIEAETRGSNVSKDGCTRQERWTRQKSIISETLYEYAQSTTLHGIPYMTRRGLSLVEKMFWFITFVTSLFLCFWYICDVWVKWQNSPVLVTVSERLVPVALVPFPSVTICPQAKIKASKYNFFREISYAKQMRSRNYSSFDSTEKDRLNRFTDIINVCDPQDRLRWRFPRPYSDATTVHNIIKESLDYDDVFDTSIYSEKFDIFTMGCEWRNKTVDCNDLFQKVLTEEGVCYNMNSLALNEMFRDPSDSGIQQGYTYLNSTKQIKGWSMEHGYTNLMDPNSYPRHGMESSGIPDLLIVFKCNVSETDYSCKPTSSGYRVYIQHPADFPQSMLYNYDVHTGQTTAMALSFSILNTSDTLRDMDAQIRQCYFHDERYLRYFKLYTEQNCRLECVANYTYDFCGCVSFYMPFNRSDRICTTDHHECMKKTKEQMVYDEFRTSKGCNCLPACVGIDYEAEVLHSAFTLKNFYETVGNDYAMWKYGGNYSDLAFSKLVMYFKKPRFISMRRSELFGRTDFLANCGGLLGLFLGFSFLSLVEIYYFITLRLWCSLKKNSEEEKSETTNKTMQEQNGKF